MEEEEEVGSLSLSLMLTLLDADAVGDFGRTTLLWKESIVSSRDSGSDACDVACIAI